MCLLAAEQSFTCVIATVKVQTERWVVIRGLQSNLHDSKCQSVLQFTEYLFAGTT